MMRFSLLSLVGLVALVALEMITLKTPTANRLAIVSYVVYFSLLASTWGAFCLGGRFRQFCKGVAILAWANVFYSVFVREDYFITNKSSPLARTVAEFLEHPLPADQETFGSSNNGKDDWIFFKIWNYWGILNIGVIGGFFALQIRNPLIATPTPEKTSAPKAPPPELIGTVSPTSASVEDRKE